MRRAAHGGFTLMELAICLSIIGILVPLVYVFYRGVDADHRRALAELESARAHQTVREEVVRDLWTLRWADARSPRLVGPGPCREVTYEVTDATLRRRGEGECGPPRALARNVREVRRLGDALQLTFAHRVGGTSPFVVVLPYAQEEAP